MATRVMPVGNERPRSAPARPFRWRRGTSPVNAYLRLNRRLWKHLPAPFTTLRPVRAYAQLVHRLAQSRAPRRQYFGTYFFRNRPQLELICRVLPHAPIRTSLKLAILACSNGAEAYTILWMIRTRRPALKVIAHGVDISRPVLELARRGTYSRTAPELVGAPVFARITDDEMRHMFDAHGDGDEVTVKPWLKEGLTWHLADATSAQLADAIGRQDVVVANNFLCHMRPRDAERALRNVSQIVVPGGVLVVSGIDLDVRTRVARDLGWTPVRELIDEVHDGDPSVRGDWPTEYWGLEPLDKTKPEWPLRYATVFRTPGPLA